MGDDIVELTLYYDSSGSWMQVPVLMLMLMEMPPCEFSQYSYVDESNIYLEEDLDAKRFLQRFESLYGFPPKVNAIDCGKDASHIRSMKRNERGTAVTIH